LIRKYYGIAPDGHSLVGIYLWESKAAASAFYTADWVAMVTKRWAVTHCGHKLEVGNTILTTDLMLQEFVARIFRSESPTIRFGPIA
jgi:hypothetical protein